MGPIFGPKILRKGFYSTKIAKKKNVKSAIFEMEKPLEMGSDSQNFRNRNSQTSHVLREKNP